MALWRLTVAALFLGIPLSANSSKALAGQSPNPGNVATDEPENIRDSSASPVRIVCSAISQDERRRTNYPGETMLPVDLVVLGTARTVVGPGSNEGVYAVTVDRVLYGAASVKAVRFSFAWQVDRLNRQHHSERKETYWQAEADGRRE